jgi:hypothetical protein
MSTRSNLLTVSAAAVAAFAWAGSAIAADLAVKAPAPAAPELPFFIVNDNSVSFTWAPSATDPGVGSVTTGTNAAFNKYTGEFTHFDAWQYGTNLLDLNYIKSDRNNPVGDHTGSTGAVEYFALWRSTLGLNQLTHSKMFSNFLFKNVEAEVGGNFNTENDGVSPTLQAYVFGPKFELNLPGRVELAVLAYKEYNHNSYMGSGAPNGPPVPGFSGDRDFKWAPRLELDVAEPLPFVPWPVTFINHTAVTFPKGTGISEANLAAICAVGQGFGCAQSNAAAAFSKTEVRTDSRLSLDASKLWFNKPGIWDMYVGYRYWYNKFGTDHNSLLFSVGSPGSSIESTAYLGMTYHFK